MLDIITHPCTDLIAIEVRAAMSNYMPQFVYM